MRALILATIFCAIGCLADNAYADDRVPAADSGQRTYIDVSAGLYTDYFFRGLRRYDGTSFQPAADVTFDLAERGSFTAQGWMHLPLEQDRGDTKAFNELDGTVLYSYPFGPLSLSAGHTSYAYPREGDRIADTAEMFAELEFDSVLQPRISSAYDYRAFDSFYHELTLHHRFEYPAIGGASLTPFAAFGWTSSRDTRYERNGLAQVTWGLLVDARSGDLVVTPNLSYTQAVDGAAKSQLWAGVTIGYSFPIVPGTPGIRAAELPAKK